MFKFQTLAPRGINRDFSFKKSRDTRARIFFRTRKQFHNSRQILARSLANFYHQ